MEQGYIKEDSPYWAPQTLDEDDNQTQPDNFHSFYMKHLLRESRLSPGGEPNEEDYQPRKPKNIPFKNTFDRAEDFYKSHEEYKSNSLEDLQRQQAFYVLEQFYSDARQRKNNNQEEKQGSDVLQDYFSQIDNISFFASNKIR